MKKAKNKKQKNKRINKEKMVLAIKTLKKDLLTIPNLLTAIRIAFVPFVLWMVFVDTITSKIVAFLLFAIASITDFFDGYFARKYNSVSISGKMLDPLADKFIVILTLVLLSSMNKISVLPVILILAREFYIFGIRSLAIENKLVIPAGMGGKIKTMLQMFSLGFFIVSPDVFKFVTNINFNTLLVGKILLWVSVFFSYESAFTYTRNVKKHIFGNK